MLKIDLKRLTLDKVADEFAKVWIGSLPGRGSASDWLEFVEKRATISIAQLVRKESHYELIEELGYAFGWLCCFVKYYTAERHGEPFMFSRSLSKMVWRKFPGMCYACAHKFTPEDAKKKGYLACICLAPIAPKKKERIRKARLKLAIVRKRRPRTLDGWAGMIKKIYGPNHRNLSLSAICLHFLEECGEVAKGLRELQELAPRPESAEKNKKICELQDEIADVFSWIFGLLNKLDQILENSRKYYKASCNAKLRAIKASTVAAKVLEKELKKKTR